MAPENKPFTMVLAHNAPVPSRAANAVQVIKMVKAFSDEGLEMLLVVPRLCLPHALAAELQTAYGVEQTFRTLGLPRTSMAESCGPLIWRM